MKKVGIICEYNPLHNGHIYHYNQIKKESNADIIILSMSSSLTQRGDLAVLDKFTRTEHALKMGIDLIIECPSILSMNEAYKFAYAHVYNLNKLNIDEIWIGSECNDIELIKKYYTIKESIEFQNKVDNYLKNGLSFKDSYKKAFKDLNSDELKSNDMLGLYYYEAILNINSNIKLKTIKRTNSFIENDFNSSNIQSASSIRCNIDKAYNYVPDYVFKDLNNIFDIDKIVPFIKYNILSKKLNNLAESCEGIENRLKFIKKDKFELIVDELKTKRYTEAKIKRLLLDVCFNITKDDIEYSLNNFDYIRVLGFNDTGKSYLNNIKKNIIIYTNIKEGINKSLDKELYISKVIDLIYNTNLFIQEQKGPIKI